MKNLFLSSNSLVRQKTNVLRSQSMCCPGPDPLFTAGAMVAQMVPVPMGLRGLGYTAGLALGLHFIA